MGTLGRGMENFPALDAPQTGINEWEHQLFGCGDDLCNCAMGCFCPQCAYASARSKFDTSNCCFNMFCVTPCLAHSIIREGYDIRGTCAEDVCFPLCCMPCAACRLLNEVNSRGLSPGQKASEPGSQDWKVPLFGCTNDVPSCIYVCFCPQCASARARSDADESNCCFNMFALTPPVLRNIVRENYGIEGNFVCDICCGTLCCGLSICQIVQEIKLRGPFPSDPDQSMDQSIAGSGNYGTMPQEHLTGH